MTSTLINVTKYVSIAVAVGIVLYVCLLGLLTLSFVQAHLVYLHKIQLTWFKDLDTPEIFGFLRSQVTPFSIPSLNNEPLYAWHILPTELYRKHESELIREPTGKVTDITSRLGFKLLKDDPEALLVVHFHGAAGTVGSGYRTPNYRVLSAAAPDKIHVLTFDYRGFGRSHRCRPSESSMIVDGIAVLDWAIKVAEIPPSRILVFGQSMGTGVTLAVSEHFALEDQPVVFAGTVLVASFVDMASLAASYRLVGIIPIIPPLARFPRVFNCFRSLIKDKWPSKNRIARYIKANEENGIKYRITIVHTEDDWDIPYYHTQTLFWHAVNSTTHAGLSLEELDEAKESKMMDLGAAGTIVEWQTAYGNIREEILKYGMHNVIMGNSIITMAVMRSFAAADSNFP